MASFARLPLDGATQERQFISAEQAERFNQCLIFAATCPLWPRQATCCENVIEHENQLICNMRLQIRGVRSLL